MKLKIAQRYFEEAQLEFKSRSPDSVDFSPLLSWFSKPFWKRILLILSIFDEPILRLFWGFLYSATHSNSATEGSLIEICLQDTGYIITHSSAGLFPVEYSEFIFKNLKDEY